jgi:proteasome lid subunit RPN8/RPN11
LVSDEQVNSSTSPKLLIPSPIHSAMIAQALAEAPLECCGLLAGQGSTVAASYPLVNAACSPTEYESEPESLFAAHKDIRRHGWDVLAVYHSHPTSPPIPSRTDLARAYWAGVVHFIISLQTSQPEVRGWWLNESEYQEAKWEVR